jgi:hypothetical protein
MRRPLLVLAGAAGVLLAVLAARIYANGYGADNDTWLMLGTWDVLVDEHRYVPSRPPGYLLAEVLYGAAAAVGGHWLSNAVSLVLGAVALAVLHRLVRARVERAATAALLVAVLAVTPAFVVAATTSIDYVVGLGAFLAGWALLERDRPTALGGLVLGLAAAARLAYAPLVLVVVLLGPGRSRPLRDRVLAVGVAAAVAILAAVPSYRFTGDLSFLTAARPTGQGIAGVAGRALLKGADVLGVVGSAIGIVVVVLVARGGSRGGRDDRWLLAVVAVQLLVWLWIPAEPSYLLPALAALLVWIAGRQAVSAPAVTAALAALVGALAVYAVVDVRLVDVDHDNRYGYETCDPTEATGARFRPHVEAGPLLDYPAMADQLRACNEQQRAGQRLVTPP